MKLSILENIQEGGTRPNRLYYSNKIYSGNKISVGDALRSFLTGLLFCVWITVGSATAHAQERPDSFASIER